MIFEIDYNDLEKELDEIDDKLYELECALADVAYDDYDLHIWDKGNYEDVQNDLSSRIDKTLNSLISTIDRYNEFISNMKDNFINNNMKYYVNDLKKLECKIKKIND